MCNKLKNFNYRWMCKPLDTDPGFILVFEGNFLYLLFIPIASSLVFAHHGEESVSLFFATLH